MGLLRFTAYFRAEWQLPPDACDGFLSLSAESFWSLLLLTLEGLQNPD